jgi:hypothetical protein
MAKRRAPSGERLTFEELELQKLELMEQLKSVEEKIRCARKTSGASPTPRGRPVRVVILDALDDLGGLAYSRELALYVKARYGRDIPATRFGSLATDEQEAFASPRSNHAVHLCHALTADRFEAIKRLWGRSDWPLWKRIVAPTTLRVQHLEMTAQLCALASAEASDTEMMKIIAADHARDLPGVSFKRGMFPLEEWRKQALALLKDLAPRDRELRGAAAERLEQKDAKSQLFGVPESPLIAVAAATSEGS